MFLRDFFVYFPFFFTFFEKLLLVEKRKANSKSAGERKTSAGGDYAESGTENVCYLFMCDSESLRPVAKGLSLLSFLLTPSELGDRAR